MWRTGGLQDKPLFYYLMVLATAGVVPVLLFSALLIWQLQTTQLQRAKNLVATQAHELQVAIEREFKNTISLLQVLAGSHALANEDYQSFYYEALAAARRSGGNILLVEPTNFDQIINTFAAFGVDLPPTSAPETAERVVQGRVPDVSHLVMGKVSKNWVFNIEVPVVRNRDEVRYVLILSFPATHILEIIKEQEIFPSSIAIVTDQTGRIIAHTTEHGKFVGKQLPSGFQGGDIANVSDGAPASGYIAATSRSSVAGWNVIVSVPKTAMMAAYRRVWTWLLAMGIGFIVLSILLAAAIARTISAPAQALSEAALALGRGERVTERRTLIREINSVSGALVAASNRIHEGRESEARLATVLRASGEAIYSLSAENIIETWNPAAEKLFGYGADEIVGQSIDVIVPDEAQKERRQLFSRATPGTVVTFEALRMRKGGECFPAAITVASIPRSANHGSGFVSVARDISDRKAYEERVRFLIAELSHRTKISSLSSSR